MAQVTVCVFDKHEKFFIIDFTVVKNYDILLTNNQSNY